MTTQGKDKPSAYYETKLMCPNCKNEIEVHIQIGMSVKEYRKKAKCNICHCSIK